MRSRLMRTDELATGMEVPEGLITGIREAGSSIYHGWLVVTTSRITASGQEQRTNWYDLPESKWEVLD